MATAIPTALSLEKALKSKAALQRGQRIKFARNLATLTRKDMFLRYNINPNTLHAWEKGVYCLSEKNAVILLEAFRKEGLSITKEWLLYGENSNLQSSPTSAIKDLKDALNVCEELKFLKEIQFFRENNMNAMSTMISDEALSPIFCRGDYVGGINILGANIKSLVGEFCIITTTDDNILIRKILSHQKNNFYMVGSINPYVNLHGPHYYSCRIKAAAKITRHWYLDKVYDEQAMSSLSTKNF